MAGKIFVNYRRGDDPGFTQALYQQLENAFPAGDLFMDVEGHIKPGDDFVEVLNSQVAACDVLLAVIGPRWVGLMAARRGDPDDFVTVEIRAALEQGKCVIPVLVGGAGIPRTDMLPNAIRPLARRNAVSLRSERFRSDCQGLVTALKERLASAEERAATGTERQIGAARTGGAGERARGQAAEGVSAEEIRKTEHLKSGGTAQANIKPKAARPKRDLTGLQIPCSSISNSARIKEIRLDMFREGSLVRQRFARLEPGMTVAEACEHVTKFDLACAIPRGRVVLRE